jgi:hypothetical protein
MGNKISNLLVHTRHSETYNDPQATKITGGTEQIKPVCAVSLRFESNGFLDFVILERNQRVVFISSGVILGENPLGFGVTAFVDEPSRRFRDKPLWGRQSKRKQDDMTKTHDEQELDDGGHALENRGDTPRPAARDTEGTESRPSSHDRSREPESVIERCERSTMGRIGNFTDQERGGHLSERSTETDEETGADEHAEVLRAGLEGGTDQDNRSTDHDTIPAAKDIGHIWSQGDTAQRTDGLNGVEETQVLGAGISKVLWDFGE